MPRATWELACDGCGLPILCLYACYFGGDLQVLVFFFSRPRWAHACKELLVNLHAMAVGCHLRYFSGNLQVPLMQSFIRPVHRVAPQSCVSNYFHFGACYLQLCQGVQLPRM